MWEPEHVCVCGEWGRAVPSGGTESKAWNTCAGYEAMDFLKVTQGFVSN